jgi:hypothetical protein
MDLNGMIRSFSDGESPARIRPISVLVGTAPKELIEVHFNPNIICPAPPRFEEGKQVLAFLRRARDGNGYATVARHYGAKTLSEAETRAYLDRIADWTSLNQQHPAGVPTNAIVEWLVGCVENPATLHEGAEDLVDRWPLLGTNLIRNAYARHLTPQQFLRISNVVFRAEYATSGVLTLYDLFKDERKAHVIRHALGCLRRASKLFPPLDNAGDAVPEPWNTLDVMSLLADLVGDPAAQAFVKRCQIARISFRARAASQQLKEFLPLIETAAVKKGYLKASESTKTR